MTAAARQSEQWADRVEATKIGRGSEKYEKNIDTRAYVGEKSRRMQMRRKNLERRQNQAIEEKSSLLNNIEIAEDLKLFPLRHYKEEYTSHLQGTLEEYAQTYGIDETLFKALLRKLDFSRTQFDKRIEEYSGGQKKKVLIDDLSLQ